MISSTRIAPPLAQTLNADLHELYERVRQSVVLLYRNGGNGAGTIWRPDGTIVTNNHVVSGDGKVNVVLADGRTFVGIVARRHPTRDLAVIKIAEENLPAASIADSSLVRPGELAFAVGHPLGYRDAITAGTVVAAGHSRSMEGPAREDAIQTDATFAPGNSGGPLVNHRGEVIGIATRVSGALGLAIPSTVVQAFAGADDDATGRGYIGISGQLAPLRGAHVLGFVITGIEEGSPADQAGLILGDVVVESGGKAIEDQESIPASLLRVPHGDPIALIVLRGGDPVQFDVVPRMRPVSDPAE